MTDKQFTATLAQIENRWRAQGMPRTPITRDALGNLRALFAADATKAGEIVAAALKAGRQPNPVELGRVAKSAMPAKAPLPAKRANTAITASRGRPSEYRIRGVFTGPITLSGRGFHTSPRLDS